MEHVVDELRANKTVLVDNVPSKPTVKQSDVVVLVLRAIFYKLIYNSPGLFVLLFGDIQFNDRTGQRFLTPVQALVQLFCAKPSNEGIICIFPGETVHLTQILVKGDR